MYLQFPTIHKNAIVCVGNDALWLVNAQGSKPQRLSESMPGMTSPAWSPDGQRIAFVARHNLYIQSLEETTPRCVAIWGMPLAVLGWKDPQHILVLSSYHSPFRYNLLYSVNSETGQRENLNFGPLDFLSYDDQGRCALQRNGYGYAGWKQYQGGLTGYVMVKHNASTPFQRILTHIKHNVLQPLWIQGRIYFISDYEGYGNVYSCTPSGEDIKAHTDHKDFYVRQQASDGHSLVYSCGGELFIIPENQPSQPVPVMLATSSPSIVKRDPKKDLTCYRLSPNGKRLAITTRGRLFQMTPYKGPVWQCGIRDGVRYRLVTWLHDHTLLALYDRGLSEVWELYLQDAASPKESIETWNIDIGRITSVKPSPKHRRVLCTNHRHEIVLLDFDAREATIVDRSPYGPIAGYNWSPCGRWVAYGNCNRYYGSCLCIYDTQENKVHKILDETFSNGHPVFDPEGKVLYFLSERAFNSNWDALGLHMFVSCSTKPYGLVLQRDVRSPFKQPFLLDQAESDNTDSPHADDQGCEQKKNDDSSAEPKDKAIETIIHFEGLDKRIIEFPLPTRPYVTLECTKGKIFYMVYEDKGTLYAYDLNLLKEEELISNLDSVTFSMDQKWTMYEKDHRLRLIATGAKPDDSPDSSFHAGGWLDWSRVSLNVQPTQEWRHMLAETWRLMREMFWSPNRDSLDWDQVYQKFQQCISRVSCMSEMLSVLYELQGENRTSHAYVDYHRLYSLPITMADLAASWQYDAHHQAYRLESFIQGDSHQYLPLQEPGINLQEGDLLWSIGGQKLDQSLPPEHCLDHRAQQALPIEVSKPDGTEKRTIVVFPVSMPRVKHLLYRQWVNRNRQRVHQYSQGRFGYVHVPNMSQEGYNEFIRSYMAEFDREGLIIDLRYNGGGNNSYIILDILSRKRVGYDQSRHQGSWPYPSLAPRGPMVGLINEFTGSDGDIGAHMFSLKKLGPLVGKRTWGGVVGMWARYSLIDGSFPTQPEYSFWFHDVGWSVENHGVDPTIEVDITPEDYQNGIDAQLERGLAELDLLVTEDVERQRTSMIPPELPDLS